jgi:hypothetical protein
MPLQSSGAISLTDIQTEFGGANPISINEYYQNGGIVGTVFGIPSSGQIAFSDFYGKSNFIMPDMGIIALGYDSSTPYNSVTGSYGTISTSNIITNQGVVGSDTNTTNNNITGRYYASGSGYGGDKGILLYGFPSNIPVNKRNLISNLGIVADDSTTSGAARAYQKQAEYGGDKAIVIGGAFGTTSDVVYNNNNYNLISNTGVVATDSTAGSGFLMEYGGGVQVGVRYGGDKAYFHKFLSSANGPFSGGMATSSQLLNWNHNVNLVSNTGAIANDITLVMNVRTYASSSGYGNDKAILAYGYRTSSASEASAYLNSSTLISNTGTVASNSNSLGTTRQDATGTTYGRDKAIVAYGNLSGTLLKKITYVNNLGVLTSEIDGVGKNRSQALGAGIG